MTTHAAAAGRPVDDDDATSHHHDHRGETAAFVGLSTTLEARGPHEEDAAAQKASLRDYVATTHADAACVVMFTSGTTGAPKPIRRSSRQVLAAARRMRDFEKARGLLGADGTLSFLPMYHMMGFSHNFVLNLVVGGKLLINAAAPTMPLTLGLLLEAAPALRPSAVETVALVADQLAEMLDVGGELARDIRARLASAKCLKVGGSPLKPRTVDALAKDHALSVLQHYGQTELCGYVLAACAGKATTTSASTSRTRTSSAGHGGGGAEGDAPADHHLKSDDDGEPVVNMEVVGGDTGATRCRLSRNGELVITALDGFFGDDNATSDYATGDIFAETAPGRYTFRSRVDGMLVLGSGEMVEPRAVEQLVLRDVARHVKRCCLVGDGRQRPALIVELVDQTAPPSDAVLAALTRTVDALNATSKLLDSPTTKLLHTHVLVIDDRALPTTLKGAVDASATKALYNDDLDAADAGTLVHSSLQAFNMGYGPKE
eukprot:CAMPEP_0185700402 /NCGR_PEP_ID=MMETSP1164-20130828/7475_1 /TAXON_ID=1104430 /ORGANISM="Chrysoreinhardia sp, Strain CCMP2950" /LENGTH=488 /DNA_ID=CAMNT_0028367353 /DNA_START=8 /DNA_END=1475 /DNA_ORIENTATION=+